MTAEVLRRAAALMRTNAEAAYDWTLSFDNLVAMPTIKWDVSEPPSRHYQRTYDTVAYNDGTTIHMASWHPAVALAVADWLDSVAHDFDENTILDAPEAGEGHWPNPDALWCDYCGGAIESPNYAADDQRCKCERWSRALAAARTYLGTADV